MEHKASGAIFAQNYSLFTRSDTDPVLYDPKGMDVSQEYTLDIRLSIASIYVYPSPGPTTDEVLLTEYQLRMRDVAIDKGPIQIIRSFLGSLDAAFGLRTIYFSDFTFESGITWYSFLALLGKGEWFILYRISVPEISVTEEIIAAIIQFISEFDYSVIR